MTDTIHISKLALWTRIGINEDERKEPQALFLDMSECHQSDDWWFATVQTIIGWHSETQKAGLFETRQAELAEFPKSCLTS